jgi:ParB/RepB/Spo0J family partition protein
MGIRDDMPVGVRKRRLKMAPEGCIRGGMDAQADGAPIEVETDALGERLAAVRLLRRGEVEMAASLRRHGQLTPLLGYRSPAGTIEVIDGLRRLRAAQQYGVLGRLRVQVLAVDERGALAALLSLHRGSQGLTELEQALVVRELVRKQGMMQLEVARLLRRDPSWVSRRLLLVESLCETVQQDVRLGLVPISAARQIARLPRGTQAAAAMALAKRDLSVREAERLCEALRKAGAASEDDVERHLEDSAPVAPIESPEIAGYRAALGAVSAAAMRLGRRLCDKPPSSLSPDCAEAVEALAAPVRSTLALLLSLMESQWEKR